MPPDMSSPDGPGASADGAPPDRSAPAPDGEAAADTAAPNQGLLRVATLNCRCMEGDYALRARGMAAEIKRLAPDAVGLQEVCSLGSGSARKAMADTLLAELKQATGKAWELRRASTHTAWGKYDEGLAVLAPAGAIKQWGSRALPRGQGMFPRKVIWARVATPRGSFYLYSTHLDVKDWKARVAQAKELLAEVGKHAAAGLPQLVVGDFNDLDWTGPIKTITTGPPAFTDTWATRNPGQPGHTISASKPERRIDYIFARTDRLASIKRVEIAFHKKYQGTWLSDHRGVFAELVVKQPNTP